MARQGPSAWDEAQFNNWKLQLTAVLYDWLTNHHLTWPSLTCRWGPRIEELTFKYKYRLYFSESTNSTEREKIIIANADVCKRRVASTENVSSWMPEQQSPYIKPHKVLFHPGEVNKIRELPQHPHIIVTHTDAPELYVWNVDKQPNRLGRQHPDSDDLDDSSVPDLTLTGHKKQAQFALSTCSVAPMVASGGSDHLVLLWNLEDSMSSLLAGAGGSAGSDTSPTLAQCTTFKGHTKTVEDVCFRPGSRDEVASVGDDHHMLFWDRRAGEGAVHRVEHAHGKVDLHCVDWSALTGHSVATGAADGTVKVWDTRMLGHPAVTSAAAASKATASANARACIFIATEHKEAVMRLDWHPTVRGVLASGGEDGLIMVWDVEGVVSGSSNGDAAGGGSGAGGEAAAGGAGGATAGRARKPRSPSDAQLLFQHAGHAGPYGGRVVDFQWCGSDPWTMLSVSEKLAEEEGDDGGGGGGGGSTLQLWRMNDMIYRPEAEVLTELAQKRAWVVEGKNPPKPPARKQHLGSQEPSTSSHKHSAAKAADKQAEGRPSAKGALGSASGQRASIAKPEGDQGGSQTPGTPDDQPLSKGTAAAERSLQPTAREGSQETGSGEQQDRPGREPADPEQSAGGEDAAAHDGDVHMAAGEGEGQEGDDEAEMAVDDEVAQEHAMDVDNAASEQQPAPPQEQSG